MSIDTPQKVFPEDIYENLDELKSDIQTPDGTISIKSFDDPKLTIQRYRNYAGYVMDKLQEMLRQDKTTLVLPLKGAATTLGTVAVFAPNDKEKLLKIPRIYASGKGTELKLFFPDRFKGGNIILLDGITDSLNSSRDILKRINVIYKIRNSQTMAIYNRQDNRLDVSQMPWTTNIPGNPQEGPYALSGGFDSKIFEDEIAAWERMCGIMLFPNSPFPHNKSFNAIKNQRDDYINFLICNCIFSDPELREKIINIELAQDSSEQIALTEEMLELIVLQSLEA